MIYSVEKHTTVQWMVVVRRDESDKINELVAKCPSEGIALTIKGLYKDIEKEDEDNE